ncbi:MAG: PIG-L family deacetylase [Bacteroides sp.]|nr:MAG: PIG-L family deacetylase [Bacteroides sp.]
MIDKVYNFIDELKFNNIKQTSFKISKKIISIIRYNITKKGYVTIGMISDYNINLIYQDLILELSNLKNILKNIYIFNISDFYPINNNNIYSTYHYLSEFFLKKINFPIENFYNMEFNRKNDIEKSFKDYDNKIQQLGNFDLIILKEPLNNIIYIKNINYCTGIIDLSEKDIERIFSNYIYKDIVYKNIWSIGLNTILKSSHIISINNNSLINHPNIEYYTYHNNYYNKWNNSKESLLSISKDSIKKTIYNISIKNDKPISKFTLKDYQLNPSIIGNFKSIKNANNYFLNIFKKTIVDDPGVNENNKSKNIIVFSPHPDDDIISMGGTIIRLHNMGYNVNIVYQTSGNIAVSDEYVLKYLDSIKSYSELLNYSDSFMTNINCTINNFFKLKNKGDKDLTIIRKIKGIIRRNEAKSTCRLIGIKNANIHFLDMPFYETGYIKKKDLSYADFMTIVNIILKINPAQIYSAGDWLDPHGTHKKCFQSIIEAINIIKSNKLSNDIDNCLIWLYKGAWDEWNIYDVDMAISMNNEEIKKKNMEYYDMNLKKME